jgi:ubiquinone/menaquinone biosynthesis C-methylase UbiE
VEEAEFDKFADEYYAIHADNISISGEEPSYFAEYKIRDIVKIRNGLRRHTDGLSILDFGAGVGTSVPFLRRYMPEARVTCLDVSSKSLAIGRLRFGNDAEFVLFDGTSIPFPDLTFDVVFAACVFHHIDHQEHLSLLREIFRILVPGGAVLVYEHNPYNPVTRHAVNTCVFDSNARLISARVMRQRFLAAGFLNSFVRYRVFFPASLQRLRPLEPFLTWLPIGAQYYVAAYK